MRLLHTTLALCCFVAALPSQSLETRREKIRKKIAAMSKAMREGKIREYNVYVKVRLKNGNKLHGVVKNGRFIELDDGLDFVSAGQVNDAGAGMRIWYTVGAKSYVFIPYDRIREYTIGSRLSDEQVKLIELKIEEKLAETRENYKRLREAAKRLQGDKAPKGGPGEEETGPKLPAAQDKLLKDFPPEEGWGKEMLDRLKKRRITLGVYPNPKEDRFEKNYDAWVKAYDALQKLKEAEKDKGAEPSKEPSPEPGKDSGAGKDPGKDPGKDSGKDGNQPR